MRADAQRNRDRLLEMAVDAFTRRGPDVTLDAIAKAAGVGIGTLYRHFPTREALIEAAYRNELGRLCDAAPELLDTMPPDRALREWMARFVGYMTTKREMSDALVAVIASGGNPYAESWDRLVKAVESLLAATGSTVDPGDVLYSLSGITMVANEAPERVSAERLLDLLMKAL
jgi:AcrR family transcriptional regulator